MAYHGRKVLAQCCRKVVAHLHVKIDNKNTFYAFAQRKTKIEQIFGEPLDCQLLPEKRASRIRYVISSYGLNEQDHWNELQVMLIDAMIRLEEAFRFAIRTTPK